MYGDKPNELNLQEEECRYDLSESDKYYMGITESFGIDNTKHSLFGCSKASADMYVQEYSRYFGLKTVVLRGGCLTGGLHRGAKLHGFLNYLVRSAIKGEEYEIIGYRGKQVRDNLHAKDIGKLCQKIGREEWIEKDYINNVYNLGGGRNNSTSILEVATRLKDQFGLNLNTKYNPTPRIGDHQWYISDITKLATRFDWKPTMSIPEILEEIIASVK